MTLAGDLLEEVRRRMESRGMSQTGLARATGIPATLVHRAMNRERDLTLDELERIAPALGVSVLWLIRRACASPVRGARSESNSAPRQD